MSLILDKVNYIYGKNTAFEHRALNNISLVIPDGQFIGLIGHTGSGKSTLIQHLNGLIRATEGAIYYDGRDIYDDDFNMKQLRSNVGLVFQYPEHQLFEVDVFTDVCFGPKNLGLPKEETNREHYTIKEFKNIDVYSFDNLEEREYNIGLFKFKVIFNPGHSSDSVSYYFYKDNLLFCGDFIFKNNIGRCDLPNGNIKEMMNPAAGRRGKREGLYEKHHHRGYPRVRQGTVRAAGKGAAGKGRPDHPAGRPV